MPEVNGETGETRYISAEVLANLILNPIDHCLAAACREALRMGAPTDKVINLLLNHLASVAAMVEPSGAREQLIRDLVAAFAPMVGKHVERRYTTPGGIVLPQAGA